MTMQKRIQVMLRRPSAFARFQMTGELPRGVVPHSPLISALQCIAPSHRARMRGFVVDSRLGYGGSRLFHTVEQAMRWLAPDDEVFGAFPAESWRMKGFSRRIGFCDVMECCADVPQDIVERYRL